MRSILDKSLALLQESTEVKQLQEAVKPYENSELHDLTSEEIQAKLLEARRGQHWLKQFSPEELAHQSFVAEAVAILQYRSNLDEKVVSVHKDGDRNITSVKTVSDTKSKLHLALDRALSTQKKLSPVQVQRNKDRWAKIQSEKNESVEEIDEAVSSSLHKKLTDLGYKKTSSESVRGQNKSWYKHSSGEHQLNADELAKHLGHKAILPWRGPATETVHPETRAYTEHQGRGGLFVSIPKKTKAGKSASQIRDAGGDPG